MYPAACRPPKRFDLPTITVTVSTHQAAFRFAFGAYIEGEKEQTMTACMGAHYYVTPSFSTILRQ
jgi:hypothetical protein